MEADNIMKELKALGRNIKRLRQKRGLTDVLTAAMINMSPRYFQALEAGKVSPRLSTLSRLTGVLRCEMADFFALGVKQNATTARDRKDGTA